MECYNGQLRDVAFTTYSKRSYSKKNGNKTTIYCDDVLTFDIEVTSAWIDENGNVIPYRKGETEEYWNSLRPLSLCYIWQFSFNDKVYYGRELIDFLNVLNDLPENIHFIIWVHNLSYEFHFLSNIFHWDKVFSKTPHQPMKASAKEYPNIEFRCSYMLTRLSLDSWGKQIGCEKKTGDLDYEVLRTPLTPLTDTELGYCEQDCIVVYKGISKYLSEYGHMRDIPLTQTGTVRLVVKKKLTCSKSYVKNIKKLVPNSAEEYKRLLNLFAGGYTHANRYYSGKVQQGHIEHYDFASSYPTVMIAEKYPMSIWFFDYSLDFPTDDMFEDTAYIFNIEFINLKCQTFNTYIQASKSSGENIRFDNGRVLSADRLTIRLTEQDYLIVRDTYTWENMIVHSKYKARKDYLPKQFTEYILELYKNKTELKDVDNMEDLYMQSKQYINSMFGMCVTAIVQADVSYNDEDKTWNIQELTTDYVEKRLNKLRDWHEREKRYFLSYSWGVYVTAYARRNLWKCIESVDSEVLYCDTDSIFVKGEQNFEWYDKEITEKLRKACEIQGLDFEKTRPKTKKGKEKPLGVFSREEDCIEFLTLGAKRYVERRTDGKLYLTVSGINKEAVGMLNDNIENFKDGFVFDKDNECVNKRLHTYCYDMPVVTYPDGYLSVYKDGINMRRTGYTITMTDEYKRLIDYTELDLNSLTDHDIMRIKNYF